MNQRLLPPPRLAILSAWEQVVYAFLAEKGRRSGSRRTVESYGQMLWPFFARHRHA